MSWEKVASGLFASHPATVEGPIRVVAGLQAIVALMREPQGEPAIIVTNVAGGSAVSTIIRRAKAIVSTIGGPNSHIVVVARDYNMPCIVGASGLDLATLANGDWMRMTADGGIEVRRAESPGLSDEQMRLLRTIAFAGALQTAADIIEFDGDVAAALDGLARSGLIETDAAIALTAAGNTALEDRYPRDRLLLEATRRDVLHDEFRPLDREIKRIASAWQAADSQDDWEGRLKTVEALSRLHGDTLDYLERHGAALPRFGEYRRRLARAHDKVLDGETDYLVAVRCDSYHTVWFTLHEDLLRILQRERDPE